MQNAILIQNPDFPVFSDSPEGNSVARLAQPRPRGGPAWGGPPPKAPPKRKLSLVVVDGDGEGKSDGEIAKLAREAFAEK